MTLGNPSVPEAMTPALVRPGEPREPIVFICAPENGHPPYVGVGPGIRACPICGRGAP